MRDAVLFLYKIGGQVFEIMGTFDVQTVEPENYSPEVETFIESVMSGALDTFKLYDPQTIGEHPDGATAFASVMRRSIGTVTFRSCDVLSMSRASVWLKKEYVNHIIEITKPPEGDEGGGDDDDINTGIPDDITIQ